jgi:hypothetical protein
MRESLRRQNSGIQHDKAVSGKTARRSRELAPVTGITRHFSGQIYCHGHLVSHHSIFVLPITQSSA